MRAYLPSLMQVFGLSLFILALTQDGYYIEGHDPRAWASAWGLLLLGWLGLFHGCFAWLGNPLIFASWIFFYIKDNYLALWASIGASLFMLSFLFYKTVVSSEAPTYSRITGYGLGYWLWLASAGVTTLANILALTLRSTGSAPAQTGK